MKYEVIFDTPEGEKREIRCKEIIISEWRIQFITNTYVREIFPRDNVECIKRIE